MPGRLYARNAAPSSAPSVTVSLPSIPASVARRLSGRGDSRASSSCASSTAPAAPATYAAATVWRPTPPWMYTGMLSVPSSRCESTNEPSSPIQPPASCPLAITASAPASWAATASPSAVATTYASRPEPCTRSTSACSSSAGVFASRTVSRPPGAAPRTAASVSAPSSRTPRRPRPSSHNRRSCARPASRSVANSRLTTPSAPARLPAIGTVASGEPDGHNTTN